MKLKTTYFFLNACFFLLSALLLCIVAGCSKSSDTSSGLVKVEPSANSVMQNSPQALRLYYEFAPDPQHSEITLRGPQGDIPLMGMHTMGADDLMIMINHPPLQNGEYTVSWRAVSVDASDRSRGDYSFHIQRQE